MKFSIKDFFSKCDQIRSFLRIWSHLLKKSLMGNLIFCAFLCCNEISSIVVSFEVNKVHGNDFFFYVRC